MREAFSGIPPVLKDLGGVRDMNGERKYHMNVL